jgi:hypothetical protein
MIQERDNGPWRLVQQKSETGTVKTEEEEVNRRNKGAGEKWIRKRMHG